MVNDEPKVNLKVRLDNIFQYVNDKVTSWSQTPSNDKYPSEKLVKDSLDEKISKSNISGLIKNDGTVDTNIYISASDECGTFTELQTIINNASSGDTIILNKDYKNSGNEDYIIIKKTIKIVGNGHIIDGENSNKRIFSISNAPQQTISVTVEDLYFINAEQDGAIVHNSGELIINHCYFINNQSNTTGGAVYTSRNIKTYINDSIFINNKAYPDNWKTYGGAIYKSANGTGTIRNCTFINNSSLGGTYSYDGEVENYDGDGGAIWLDENNNVNIIDCTFINNNATNGGAIFSIDSDFKVYNCTFENSTLYNVINTEYITEHQDISGKENISNKTNDITSSSTNTQYPSAKSVYDLVSALSGSGISDFYIDTETDEIVIEANGSGGGGGGGSVDIVTEWEERLSDNKVPSEKLTKLSIDGKSDLNHTHTTNDLTDGSSLLKKTILIDTNNDIDLNNYIQIGSYMYIPPLDTSNINVYNLPSDVTKNDAFVIINYGNSNRGFQILITMINNDIYVRGQNWKKVGDVKINYITLSSSKQKLNENESFKVFANVKDDNGNVISNKTLNLVYQYSSYSNNDMGTTGWVKDVGFYVDDIIFKKDWSCSFKVNSTPNHTGLQLYTSSEERILFSTLGATSTSEITVTCNNNTITINVDGTDYSTTYTQNENGTKVGFFTHEDYSVNIKNFISSGVLSKDCGSQTTDSNGNCVWDFNDGLSKGIYSFYVNNINIDVFVGIAMLDDIPSLTNYVQKSSTQGLIKNDGTIDTSSYSTFDGNYNSLTNKPTIPTDVSDLTDTQNTQFTPKNHTHTKSNITDFPTIPSKVSDLNNDSGFITSSSLPTKTSDLQNDGDGTNVFVKNNDSRLTDSRNPNSHTHGNLSNDGKIGTTANKPIITGNNGVLSVGSFGTTANTFAEGNHTHSDYASSSHNHSYNDINNVEVVNVTVTYTDNTTETIKLLKYNGS